MIPTIPRTTPLLQVIHSLTIYDRGYTLADGPWLYRFKREPPRDEVTAYVEVKDDFSFRKMVDNFKETIRKDPKYEYAISVIHVSRHLFAI
jgi:hypothetical protein